MTNNQSDFGYALPGVGGEVQWSRDYWNAFGRGDYRTALDIATAHKRDFDWSGELPEHWSDEDAYEAAQLGLCSAEGLL